VSEAVDFLVHTPAGSPAFALAEAFLAAVAESGADQRPWRLVDRGSDPGAAAMAELAARAGDPTVLSTATPIFVQAPLLRALPLTHRGLTPLTRLVADRYLLVVRADSRFADAASFLAALPTRPTRTAGYFHGGINHLLGLAIAEKAGAAVEFVLVENEPAIFKALAGGSIDWAVGVPVETLPHLASRAFRVLAVLDEARLPALPEVPTLREAGADVTFRLWRGLIGPPGLAAQDVERWLAIAEAARATASWRSYLARNGQTDDPLAGAAFASFLDREWDWHERHLGLAGLLPAQKRG
jgi:putative tricarboxylic transport membrane protein